MAEGRIAALRSAFEGKDVGKEASPKGKATPFPVVHKADDQHHAADESGPPPGGRPDTPQFVHSPSKPTKWDSTMEQLERTADGGNANKSSPAQRAGRDRNLSGVVNATSKALKAALMENEELSARNAELEAKLATGGAEDTDAREIERALTTASAALAARRHDILALEHQVATLQAENSVMIESQMRLQGAVSSHLAVEVGSIDFAQTRTWCESHTHICVSMLTVTLGSLPQTTQEGTSQLVERLANEINLLSAELVDLRAANQVSSESAAGVSRIIKAPHKAVMYHINTDAWFVCDVQRLESQYADLMICCDSAEAQRDALQAQLAQAILLCSIMCRCQHQPIADTLITQS
jgi:hypothetical protein